MDPNSYLPQIDTKSFTDTIVPPSTQIDGLDLNNLPQQPFTPDPSTLLFTNNVRYESMQKMNSLNNIGESADSIVDKMFPNSKKIDIDRVVDIRDTHEQSASDPNKWTPKYKSYVYGVDNDTRLSNMQSDFEKFMNPVKRLFFNTAKAPLDLVGSVYGIGAAALSGRFDAIYDNDYMKWVDDLTAKTNFDYKNYYNEVERNQNLGLNLQTFDKVLGGAEFTTRLLAAEALLATLTGGASLPSSMAKAALKSGELASKGNKISKALRMITSPELSIASKVENSAGKGANWFRGIMSGLGEKTSADLAKAAARGNIGDALVKTRFALTSPLYEAGFEARHYAKETEQKFWEYYRERGTNPTQEEINDFSKKLSGSADGVFFANMAILMPSNLMMMGNFLKLSNPIATAVKNNSSIIGNSLLGIGVTETAEAGFKAIKPSILQKAAAYALPVIKGGIVEGVYEEGMQGVASNTFKNYVSSSYDPKYTNTTSTYIEAFSKAMKDQFGTKEGREEVIIGAIIGGLMGGMGGIRSVPYEYKKQEKIAETYNKGNKFFEELSNNSYTNEWTTALFSHANRFQALSEQLSKVENSEDKLLQASLQAQTMISMLDAYHSIGKEEVFIDNMVNTIKGIDPQLVAENTGLDINEVDNYKNEQIEYIKELSNDYGNALKAGRYIFGNNLAGSPEVKVGNTNVKVNGEMLSNALAFSTAMSKFNERFAVQTFDAIQTKLSQTLVGKEISDKLGTITALRNMTTLEKENYYNLNGIISNAKARISKLTDEMVKLNNQDSKAPSLAEKKLQLNREMAIAQEELSEATEKLSVLEKASIDNFYSKMGKTGYAKRIDLDNFDKEVSELNDTIKNLDLNINDKILITKLFDQYNKATSAYKSFSDLVENITNQEFSPKTFNGLFAGLRAKKDKSINDLTRDTLLTLSKKYIENNYIKNKSISTLEDVITEDKLSEDYSPSRDDIEYIYNKIRNNLNLNDIEDKFYEKHKEKIDSFNETTVDNKSDILESKSVRLNYIKVKLSEILGGNLGDDLQKQVDEIQSQIDSLSNVEVSEEVIPDETVERLNYEIKEIEDKIRSIESKNVKKEDIEKNVKFSRKTEYTQYEYVKPNGNVIVGHLEINKGILQIINEDEIVDIKEEVLPLSKIDTSKIKDLKKIEEDDVLIEGREVYVNGKIYKVSLRNGTLDNSISKDKDGNYVVQLQAKNGRIVILKGSVADAIVYNNLLNKLENEFTEQKNREARELAERVLEVEKLYEELISKTEDRDSRIYEIDKQNRITQSELTKKLEELEDAKNEIIQKEIIEIEDEIAKLNGEVTIIEKQNRLEKEIETLTEEILLELVEDLPASYKKLTLLKMELNDSKRVKKDFNPNASPYEQLQWVVENSYESDFVNVSALSDIEKPSQEDIDELIELSNKKNKNTSEKRRLSELREKMSSFNIVNNLVINGVSLLDVINLYNQLKNIKESNEKQDLENNEVEMQGIINEANNTELEEGYRSEKTGLVYDGTYIKKRKNRYELFHIKLLSILEESLKKGLSPEIIVYSIDSNGNKDISEKIQVTPENIAEVSEIYDKRNNIKVNLSEDNYLIKNINETSFSIEGKIESFLDILNLKPYNILGQTSGYILLYSTNSDGTMSPKESEFTVTSDNNVINFDKEVLNNLKIGDEVTLEFDLNNDYNKTLKKSEYESKGVIYVKYNGKLVQILKGTDNTTSTQWGELKALRKKVIKNPKKSYKITVEKSYLGLPIIKLNKDGAAIENSIEESKVESYGYIDENGNISTFKSGLKIDNDQYVKPLAKKSKKSPIVVFKYGSKNIAFPINVRPKNVNLEELVDEIVNEDTSKEVKFFKLNSLLDANGLLNSDTAVTSENYNISNIKNTLSSVYESIDITNETELMETDKSIFIDMLDPFMSSKLVFNFGDNLMDSINNGNDVENNITSSISTVDMKGIYTSEEKMC